MEEKKVSIQKSIIWNSAGSMVYLITQWLISVLVVRLSGVETAGILTLAMSVNNVFYSIAMQGIRNYQVSDMKEKYTSGIYVSSRLIICILSFLVCVGYALIAGFTEIGETLEETVQREVMEEVGLKVKNIRYYKSQPWSFSSTLLCGFFCEVDGDTDITLDTEELAVGEWFDRDNIPVEDDGVSLTREMIGVFKTGGEKNL